MRFRSFADRDHEALQALDLAAQRQADPVFDTLPERERAGRLHTSLAALKFYERSEHSFVAEFVAEDVPAGPAGGLQGFVLAQPVWQGDRPIVLVRALVVSPTAPAGTAEGLLRAAVKSAYDCAVYELHFPLTPELHAAALAEGAVVTGGYAVRHLGTRQETAPGQRLAPGAGA